MTDTPNLGLPLVQPAQAQKHVTVNEALIRLDALSQIALQSQTLATPPVVVDGQAYAVPVAATDAWAGQDGLIAIGSSGGWVFATPTKGWRAHIVDEDTVVTYDGTEWQVPVLSRTASGAAVEVQSWEFMHSITAGASNTTSEVIPAGTVVLAAQARVVVDISGAASSWSLGIAGSSSQFGSGLGLGTGSYAEGLLGSPTTYYADTPLVLTGEGGDLAGGEVRLAIHGFRFVLPNL